MKNRFERIREVFLTDPEQKRGCFVSLIGVVAVTVFLLVIIIIAVVAFVL